MGIVSQKREVCEELVVAVIDRIIDARGFDGEMLFIPQRDLRARDLLRGGRVPAEVLDAVIGAIDSTICVIATEIAAGMKESAA